MISDPNLVLYACISKGTTILAEFNSGDDPNLTTLASQCLEKTPPFHSTFSHTIRKRTYTFLIENPDPFVYFSIVDENLEQSEGLWFLNRLKDALEENVQRNSIACSEDVSSYCLQGEFDSVFRKLLASSSSRVEEFDHTSRSLSLDDSSSKRKKIVSVPLLGNPSKAWLKLKKKKRRLFDEKKKGDDDDANDSNVIDSNVIDVIETREFSMSLHKNGLYDSGRQKANQIWRRHVWLVLGIDLTVCSVLFAAWLLICRGFQCINE